MMYVDSRFYTYFPILHCSKECLSTIGGTTMTNDTWFFPSFYFLVTVIKTEFLTFSNVSICKEGNMGL